jgi:hypothetical protein
MVLKHFAQFQRCAPLVILVPAAEHPGAGLQVAALLGVVVEAPEAFTDAAGLGYRQVEVLVEETDEHGQ